MLKVLPAWQDALDSNLGEVETVRRFAAAVATQAGGIRVGNARVAAFAGVVHQRTYVNFAGISGRLVKREAGDLLLITGWRAPGSSRIERRALLLQAKLAKTAHQFVKVKAGGDQEQHHLYLNWPAIEYAWPDGMSRVRRLDVAEVGSATKYLLIPRGKPKVSPALLRGATAIPGTLGGRQLTNHADFMCETLRMLFGMSGKDYDPTRSKDWDQFVTDMLSRVSPKDQPVIPPHAWLLRTLQTAAPFAEDEGVTVLRITVHADGESWDDQLDYI